MWFVNCYPEFDISPAYGQYIVVVECLPFSVHPHPCLHLVPPLNREGELVLRLRSRRIPSNHGLFSFVFVSKGWAINPLIGIPWNTHCKDSQYEWMTATHIPCLDSGTCIILYYGNYNHQYMVLVYRIFRDPQCWDLHSHNLPLN